ncbi:hypothetical protein [Rodentibacter trehalosifermentans]|uniref:hypothetical protein n=1 Tax=Rodentibacter trehalosifermentans TaxID=1908263 RepID=UPI0013015EBF|nr:hypothetical protein [Rodentibacter trehalosifermentans]
MNGDILNVITQLLKELIMEYGLWQITFAVTIPILVFVFPKLLNAIANLIRVLK